MPAVSPVVRVMGPRWLPKVLPPPLPQEAGSRVDSGRDGAEAGAVQGLEGSRSPVAPLSPCPPRRYVLKYQMGVEGRPRRPCRCPTRAHWVG